MRLSENPGSSSPNVLPSRVDILVQKSQAVIEQLAVRDLESNDASDTTNQTLTLCQSFMDARLQCSVKEDYMAVDGSKSDANVSEATAVVHNLACLSIAACCSVQFARLTTTILKKTIDAFSGAFELPTKSSGSHELKRVKDIRILLLTQYMVHELARALIDAEKHKVSEKILQYKALWGEHPDLLGRVLFAVNVARRFLKLAEHRRSVRSAQSEKSIHDLLARAFPWAELANRLKDYVSHQYQIVKKKLEYENILASAYMRSNYKAASTRSDRIVRRRKRSTSPQSTGDSQSAADYSSPTHASSLSTGRRFRSRRKEPELEPETPFPQESRGQQIPNKSASQASPVAKKSYKIPRISPEVCENDQLESSLEASGVLSSISSSPTAHPLIVRIGSPPLGESNEPPSQVEAEPSSQQPVAPAAQTENKSPDETKEGSMPIDRHETQERVTLEIAVEQHELLPLEEDIIIDRNVETSSLRLERGGTEVENSALEHLPQQTTEQKVSDIEAPTDEITQPERINPVEDAEQSKERYAMQLWRNRFLESKRRYILVCKHTLSPIGLRDVQTMIQDRFQSPTVSVEKLEEISRNVATSKYGTNLDTVKSRKRPLRHEDLYPQQQIYSPPHKRPSRSRGPPMTTGEIQTPGTAEELQGSLEDSNLGSGPALVGPQFEEQTEVHQPAEQVHQVHQLPKESDPNWSQSSQRIGGLAAPLPSVSLTTAEAIKKSLTGVDFAKAWSVVTTQGSGIINDVCLRPYKEPKQDSKPVSEQSQVPLHSHTAEHGAHIKTAQSIAAENLPNPNLISQSEKDMRPKTHRKEEEVGVSMREPAAVDFEVVSIETSTEISSSFDEVAPNNVTIGNSVLRCRQIPVKENSGPAAKRLPLRAPVAVDMPPTSVSQPLLHDPQLSSRTQTDLSVNSKLQSKPGVPINSSVRPPTTERRASEIMVGCSASLPIEISDSPTPERDTGEAEAVRGSNFDTPSKLNWTSTSRSQGNNSETADTPLFLKSEDSSDGLVSSDVDLRSDDFDMSQLEELGRKNLESNSAII